MNPLHKIAVYQASVPDDLNQLHDAIGTTVFGLKPASEDLQNLLITKVGGCISYRSSQIWKATNSQNLPSTPSQAIQVAQSWLQTAQGRVQSAAANSQTGKGTIPDNIIPFSAQPVLSTPMRAPGQTNIDHWLTIFALSITTGIQRTPGAQNQSTAPANAVAELRIGAGNKLLGYYSAWRPYNINARQMVQLLDPSGDPINSQLYYDLASPNDPQPLITPYYIVTKGEKQGQIHPASTQSLSVRLSWEDSDEGAQIKAHVDPKKQQLTFGWGYWRLDDGVYEFRQPDSGSDPQVVSLASYGVFNVVVDVSAPSCFGNGTPNVCRREITVTRLHPPPSPGVA